MYYLSLCYNIIKSTSAWKRLMGRAKARSKKDSSGTNLSNVLSFNCFLEMRSLNFVGWHPIIYIHWRVQWWELAMNYTRSVGSMTNFHIVRFHECAYVFKQCFISFWCLFSRVRSTISRFCTVKYWGHWTVHADIQVTMMRFDHGQFHGTDHGWMRVSMEHDCLVVW